MDLRVRVAARVALRVGARRPHAALTAGRLPLPLAGSVARRAAISGAGPLALPGAVALRVARSAGALALALAGSVALATALTLAVSGKASRFALRDDGARINVYVTRRVAARLRVDACPALWRRRLHSDLNPLPKDAVDLRRHGSARRLGSGAGVVRARRHLRVGDAEIATHVSACLCRFRFHLEAQAVHVARRDEKRADLRVRTRVRRNTRAREIGVSGEVGASGVREAAETSVLAARGHERRDAQHRQRKKACETLHSAEDTPAPADGCVAKNPTKNRVRGRGEGGEGEGAAGGSGEREGAVLHGCGERE